jgi:hypothetical protein
MMRSKRKLGWHIIDVPKDFDVMYVKVVVVPVLKSVPGERKTLVQFFLEMGIFDLFEGGDHNCGTR